ncbi:DUF2182 domain-containing protein [Agromyces intestinalis]|uniref:DUF2182 domain-containing protein n=1 Tax=Agromyces intestinalis TaxID=2592652 RepID=A0A5C1YK66_9MICO|nr:DUF2182 domain-containing protein [Agromyces intestinalis]QEO15670.1 DUF2182 domain-containing protein [Agromyces intestinalis]
MSVEVGRLGYRRGGPPGPLARARSTRRRRPARAGDLVLVGSGAAWVVLAAASPLAGQGWPGAHRHVATASDASPAAAPAAPVEVWTWAWLAGWLLMVAAMMWPLLAASADRIAAGSFRRWRFALPAVAVGTATALWLGFGLAAGTVAQLAAVPEGSLRWQLAALAVAALARRSAWRARLLSRCAVAPPVAPAGRRGILTAARAGATEWRRCALLCGPLMVAMVVGHSPIVLAAASLAVWWEARHPRAWRDPVPLALIIVAGIGAVGEVVIGGGAVGA